jgi:hypothetical protein
MPRGRACLTVCDRSNESLLELGKWRSSGYRVHDAEKLRLATHDAGRVAVVFSPRQHLTTLVATAPHIQQYLASHPVGVLLYLIGMPPCRTRGHT